MSPNVFSNILELYPSVIFSSPISDNKRHYTPYVFSPPNCKQIWRTKSHVLLSPFVLSSKDSLDLGAEEPGGLQSKGLQKVGHD